MQEQVMYFQWSDLAEHSWVRVGSQDSGEGALTGYDRGCRNEQEAPVKDILYLKSGLPDKQEGQSSDKR